MNKKNKRSAKALKLRRLRDKAVVKCSEPEAVPKGTKGGSCNVTACQRHNSAIFLNVGMKAYYCFRCAADIHNANERHAEKDGFTLFPAYDKMVERMRSLVREGHGFDAIDDYSNYEDIDQNPWGSCYHFDRDRV